MLARVLDSTRVVTRMSSNLEHVVGDPLALAVSFESRPQYGSINTTAASPSIHGYRFMGGGDTHGHIYMMFRE